MKITPKKIEWFKNILEQMQVVAFTYYKIQNGTDPDGVKITEYGIDTFEASYYRSRDTGLGYYNEDYEDCEDIPYSYIWDINWEQELQDNLWNAQMEYIRISDEKKKAAELHEQEQSLLQYELLKKRFEPQMGTSDIDGSFHITIEPL